MKKSAITKAVEKIDAEIEVLQIVKMRLLAVREAREPKKRKPSKPVEVARPA